MVSRLPKPWIVGPPGCRMCDQPSPIEMPKFSVMRLSRFLRDVPLVAGGTSPVLDQATVGSDSSSATQGSSIARVAGRNAGADEAMGEGVGEEVARRKQQTRSANAREPPRKAEHEDSPFGRERKSGAAIGPPERHARSGGPRGFAIE